MSFTGYSSCSNNSRSHTCVLSGVFTGNVKVLVRFSFGIAGLREVAKKLAVRSDDVSVSDTIHEIICKIVLFTSAICTWRAGKGQFPFRRLFWVYFVMPSKF